MEPDKDNGSYVSVNPQRIGTFSFDLTVNTNSEVGLEL